jgi:cytochrome c
MSDLRLNKIFGAVLGTGLVILGLQTASEVLFHAEAPEKPGYAIAIQEEAEGGGSAEEAPPDWGTVLPAADIAAGEQVFGKCLSCHNAAPGGANMTGPNLYGLVGRKPGSHGGFAYSTQMVEFGAANPAWDYQHLYEFIHSPQAYIKGTKMTFVGVKKQQDLINLIAYLRAQSASPAPIPAPNPAAAAAPAEGAAAPDANATAPADGAPAGAAGGGPTGQAPEAGAAAAPTQVTETPGTPPAPR